MSRSDIQRYDQAIAYINTHVSIDLALVLGQKGDGSKKALGKAISLAWGGFKEIGTPQFRMSIRALLLCQQIFLRPPKCESDLALNGKATKDHFKTRTETEVKDAIRSYTRRTDVSLKEFADTALAISDMSKEFNLLSRTRAEVGNWGGTINCYGGVKIWLFKSGLCSLAWLINEGNKLNAYTSNNIIGDGQVVEEKDLDTIPEGWVFNIHDSIDPAICHWGVSLGGGWAAASNTTPGGMSADGPVYVDFRKGGNPYGEFKLRSSVEVCKCTYKSRAVVVKMTDPTQSRQYY